MNRRTKRKLQRIIWTAWEYLKLAAVVMFAMAAGAACYHQYLVQHRLPVEQRWEPEIRVETLQMLQKVSAEAPERIPQSRKTAQIYLCQGSRTKRQQAYPHDSEQRRDGCPLSASEVLATRRYSCGSMDNRAKLPKAGSIFHQVCIEDRGNRGKADREKVVPVKKSQKAVCPERGNQIKPVSGAGGRERRVHAGEGQRIFGSF